MSPSEPIGFHYLFEINGSCVRRSTNRPLGPTVPIPQELDSDCLRRNVWRNAHLGFGGSHLMFDLAIALTEAGRLKSVTKKMHLPRLLNLAAICQFPTWRAKPKRTLVGAFNGDVRVRSDCRPNIRMCVAESRLEQECMFSEGTFT